MKWGPRYEGRCPRRVTAPLVRRPPDPPAIPPTGARGSGAGRRRRGPLTSPRSGQGTRRAESEHTPALHWPRPRPPRNRSGCSPASTASIAGVLCQLGALYLAVGDRVQLIPADEVQSAKLTQKIGRAHV